MAEKNTKPAPKKPEPETNPQKMSEDDCARLGLDPSVYGHKAK